MSTKQEREQYMLDLLARDGSLSVAALARDLSVSEVTIRTSLRDLENRGLLTRVHGGAQGNSYQTVLERQREQSTEKERIGAKAAELIRDGDTVMIEAGTTTALITAGLLSKSNLRVVTNSTLAFATARRNPDLHLVLTGGDFNQDSESLVGPHALRTIRDFNVRLAFIGTDGFTASRGLTTAYSEGGDIIRAMIERAEETWLVADSTKYGRAGFVSVLPLEELHGIITDDQIGEDTLRTLRDLVAEVIVA